MCPSLRLAFTAWSRADGLVLLWSSTRGISRLHVPEASRVSASAARRVTSAEEAWAWWAGAALANANREPSSLADTAETHVRTSQRISLVRAKDG